MLLVEYLEKFSLLWHVTSSRLSKIQDQLQDVYHQYIKKKILKENTQRNQNKYFVQNFVSLLM